MRPTAAALALGLVLGAAVPPARAHEPIVGLPCPDCEAVFVGLPARLRSEARLAPPGMAGESLILEGTVRDAKDRPVPGVIVYAYQPNAEGSYPPDDRTAKTAARDHGSLRAWARTDARGRYRFITIRPGPPGPDEPAPIHLHVIEPGRCSYAIDSVHFDDDPRLTSLLRLRLLASRGGRGIVKPERDQAARWRARRDIKLGQGIPGYEACGTQATGAGR